MQILPNPEGWQSFYKLLVSAVIPRPIGWISTVNAAGSVNLAPYSFFNAVCGNPPHLLWSASRRGRDGSGKDSLANARATGEFVVNIVTAALAEQMNLTSAEVPPEIDELALVGLTPAPSTLVRPPRVAESPVAFECRVAQLVEVSAEPGGATVVIGRIVAAHIDERVLTDGDIDPHKLEAVARLGASLYTTVRDTFSMTRPRVL